MIGRRQERRERYIRAIDLHGNLHEGLVDQEGEQPHHRRGGGTSGVDAAAAGRGRERRADAFLGQKFTSFGARVLDGEAQHDFARRRAARVGAAAVERFVADHVDGDIAEGRQARLLQHLADAVEHGLGHAARLGWRIIAGEDGRRDEAEAAGPGRRYLVGARRHAALRAVDAHAILAVLDHGHAGEIADDVRQDVGRRIADLIEHLFGDRQRRHRAAGVLRLGDDEGAVGETFGDRPADVFPAGFHIAPVREIAARDLRAAFEQMAAQRALSQQIVVRWLPLEFVDQRRERDSGIDAAAREHDIGAGVERCSDREGAEIGVDAHQLRRKARARLHLPDVERAQFLLAVEEIVAFHGADLQRDARLLADLFERLAAGLEIDAAGIGDDLDLLVRDFPDQRLHHAEDEIMRVALILLAALQLGEDRHGDFCEVVEDEIVDIAPVDELRGRGVAVAPITRGAANADGFFGLAGHGVLPCEIL